MEIVLIFMLLSSPVWALLYSLQQSLSGPTFFDAFDFWTAPDPTIGFVHYVDRVTAEAFGMINVSSRAVAWGVDTSQTLDPLANLGRLSIRLTSKQSWTHGLFLLDLIHMPSNQCGVWPAFWTLGSGQWPSNGEIDIIEYANTQPNNIIAAHTLPGCSIAGFGESGTLLTNNCSEAEAYTGCGVSAKGPNNVGDAFNANGGGIYAMEWTSISIRVWFFGRNDIPSTLSIPVGATARDEIDSSGFGTPVANFEGGCDIDKYFFNHSLIFDTTFCGTYAGNTWQGDGCPMVNPINGWASCNDFVAKTPRAFIPAYWKVNYLNVYQALGPASLPSSSVSSSTPAESTSSVASAAMNAQGRSTTPTGSTQVPTSEIVPSRATSTTASGVVPGIATSGPIELTSTSKQGVSVKTVVTMITITELGVYATVTV